MKTPGGEITDNKAELELPVLRVMHARQQIHPDTAKSRRTSMKKMVLPPYLEAKTIKRGYSSLE